MRGGLFWKILLGFWLTLFCIIEGLWLVFVVRGNPSPEEWIARRVAPAVLSEFAREVRRGGLVEYERARQTLPVVDRNQLSIGPIDPRQKSVDRDLVKVAVAPDGKRYQLRYAVPAREGRGGPLSIPWPIIVAGAIAGLTFSVVLAYYLTRPIKLLRDGFDRLADGDLEVRLQPRMGRRRDEIAGLARNFDVMASRLQQLVLTRDRLLHDVSHELRSPLSRMQVALALARQDPARTEQSMDRIEREAGRLEGLVREVLALARAESGLSAIEEYFDPLAVLEVVLADAQFEAEGADIRISATLPQLREEDRPNVAGNAELFRRALENIVRNALRFSPTGSVLTVSAILDDSVEDYLFSVADEGPGVQGVDLSAIFEPFIKGDRAGVGLGLAIAKRAIEAHGGTIDAENMNGGGLRIEILLPLRPIATTLAKREGR